MAPRLKGSLPGLRAINQILSEESSHVGTLSTLSHAESRYCSLLRPLGSAKCPFQVHVGRIWLNPWGCWSRRAPSPFPVLGDVGCWRSANQFFETPCPSSGWPLGRFGKTEVSPDSGAAGIGYSSCPERPHRLSILSRIPAVAFY